MLSGSYRYILEHIDREEEVLQELYRETNLKVPGARMLSGHLQGKTLSMISKMIQPEKILEIGTFTGYSAICLARGLREGGKLITIEKDDELEPIARKYFHKAGMDNKIILLIGSALDMIPSLEGSFDLVFIDADKREYAEYYNIVFEKVRSGGFIIADNTLWNGKIFQSPLPRDAQSQGIINFNELIRTDSRIEKVILPLRDGMTVIRKY
jgi:predicted O-methyltransferase YrrM